MNKAELVAKIAESTNQKKKVTEEIVNAFIEAVEEELANKGKVQLVGFGTFEVRERKARTGRNPQKKGEVVEIPASNAPVFKAGKAFKDAVNK
ncbi:MAG: HU family DNA-binding protein [Firmicutes bacterium]|nr:HU family DNA-binding protein [Bacillota bacterium]